LGIQLDFVDFWAGIGGFIDLANPYRSEEEDREPSETVVSYYISHYTIVVKKKRDVQGKELDITNCSNPFGESKHVVPDRSHVPP
jgi:hypothetical protein